VFSRWPLNIGRVSLCNFFSPASTYVPSRYIADFVVQVMQFVRCVWDRTMTIDRKNRRRHLSVSSGSAVDVKNVDLIVEGSAHTWKFRTDRDFREFSAVFRTTLATGHADQGEIWQGSVDKFNGKGNGKGVDLYSA